MRVRLLTLLCLTCLMLSRAEASETPNIRGAWHPELYQLKDGTKHPVTGLIFFAEKDWSVLYFVMDEQGPQRGSGEGGTYTLDGNRLVFSHLYNFSAGKALKGLPASDLSMKVKKPIEASPEPCTIEVKGDILTIFFPSGNLMTFRRSSGF